MIVGSLTLAYPLWRPSSLLSVQGEICARLIGPAGPRLAPSTAKGGRARDAQAQDHNVPRRLPRTLERRSRDRGAGPAGSLHLPSARAAICRSRSSTMRRTASRSAAVYSNAQLCVHRSMKETYIPEVKFGFDSNSLWANSFIRSVTVLENIPFGFQTSFFHRAVTCSQ